MFFKIAVTFAALYWLVSFVYVARKIEFLASLVNSK